MGESHHFSCAACSTSAWLVKKHHEQTALIVFYFDYLLAEQNARFLTVFLNFGFHRYGRNSSHATIKHAGARAI